ncbi:MAG: hypothetical protein ACP5JF_03695 [Candidatus Methanodesulfokora sp.]|jgi:hypothetical protein
MLNDRESKIILVVEAFFGSLYVTVTRGLFIVMLSYSGYEMSSISIVSLFSAILGVVVSYLLYYKQSIIYGRFKLKMVISHGTERFLWMSLPFFVWNREITALLYSLSMAITVPVGVFISSAMMALFKEEELDDLNAKRNIAGAAASLIAGIFMTLSLAFLPAPERYYIPYVSAGLLGLSSTLAISMLKIQRLEEERILKLREEDRIKLSTTFIFLIIMFTGSNILGIAWIPYLKNIGAPSYIAALMNLIGSVGGIVGPYLFRSYRHHRIAISTNALATLSVPFFLVPIVHPVLSFVTSATFVSVSLLSMLIYSNYVENLGIARASVLLTTSSFIGLVIASLLGLFLQPFLLLILAGLSKIIAALIVTFAVPETAVVPKEVAMGYARLIHSVSTAGYMTIAVISRQAVITALKIFALSLLLILVYFIYRLLFLITL